jgi:hypothetical protein
MAHFEALEDENIDPLPKGDDPKPEDDAEDEDTRSVLLPLLHNEDEVAKPDSLCSWPELLLSVPLAKTIPVKLSNDGVGEAAELTRV